MTSISRFSGGGSGGGQGDWGHPEDPFLPTIYRNIPTAALAKAEHIIDATNFSPLLVELSTRDMLQMRSQGRGLAREGFKKAGQILKQLPFNMAGVAREEILLMEEALAHEMKAYIEKLIKGQETGITGRTIGKYSGTGPNPDVTTADTGEVHLYETRGYMVSFAGAAGFLETGTKPHEITPGAGTVLNFSSSRLYGTMGGDVDIASGSVEHPGFQSFRIYDSAMEKLQIDKRLQQVALSTFTRAWAGAETGTHMVGSTEGAIQSVTRFPGAI